MLLLTTVAAASVVAFPLVDNAGTTLQPSGGRVDGEEQASPSSPAPAVAARNTSENAPESAPERVMVERASVHTLHSRETGADYRILVSVPQGYDTARRSYPVVYLLDAHYSFLVARNVTDHLSERAHLPQVVVVGVGYPGETDHGSPSYRLNRTRDYTPSFSPTGGYGPEYQKVSGGGPRFAAFLEQELIPFISAHYRVKDDRTLVGHSYGGLFACWLLLDRPSLFGRLIAVSPSLWYDEHLPDRLLAARPASREWPARAYLAVGSLEINQDHDMVADLKGWSAKLDQKADGRLALRAEVLDGETHNSVFPRALSNGLRYVFEGR